MCVCVCVCVCVARVRAGVLTYHPSHVTEGLFISFKNLEQEQVLKPYVDGQNRNLKQICVKETLFMDDQ